MTTAQLAADRRTALLATRNVCQQMRPFVDGIPGDCAEDWAGLGMNEVARLAFCIRAFDGVLFKVSGELHPEAIERLSVERDGGWLDQEYYDRVLRNMSFRAGVWMLFLPRSHCDNDDESAIEDINGRHRRGRRQQFALITARTVDGHHRGYLRMGARVRKGSSLRSTATRCHRDR